jgi:hypothetical protein
MTERVKGKRKSDRESGKEKERNTEKVKRAKEERQRE